MIMFILEQDLGFLRNALSEKKAFNLVHDCVPRRSLGCVHKLCSNFSLRLHSF